MDIALSQPFIAEIKHEGVNTRKMIERVPVQSFSWKPHEKSSPLINLAQHIATLPIWVSRIMNEEEFDFAKGMNRPKLVENTDELLDLFDKNLEEAVGVLSRATNQEMSANWTMRNADHIIFTLPKMQALRTVCMNHTYHHRGQLSVYLRLLNVPIPGMYGPSADEVSLI